MRSRIPWALLTALVLIVGVHGARLVINVGTSPNDNTGDTLRVAFQKINSNFAEIYLTTITNELWTNNPATGTTHPSLSTNLVSVSALRATNATVLTGLGVGGAPNASLGVAIQGDGSGFGIGLGSGQLGGTTMLQMWQDNSTSYFGFGDGGSGSTIDWVVGTLTSPGGQSKLMRLNGAGLLQTRDVVITNSLKFVNGAGAGFLLRSDANGAASWSTSSAALAMPSVKLTNGFQLIAGAGLGKAIVSDADGNASWGSVDGNVTNTYNTTIVTNLFFVSGKGNTLIITNDLNLLANPSALLMTTAAGLLTNVANFSGISFTPGTRTLAASGIAPYAFDTSIGDLSFREARVTFSAAASFDTGLGLSVSAASSATAAGNALCIPYRNLVTTTTLNNDAFANGEGMFNPLNMRHWSFIVHISSLTSNRVWCGVANTTWGNMLPSDAPAFDLAAIRYSPAPGVGDVNWMFCTSDATTQQSESTGVPATTNQTIFTFSVNAAATQWTCYINGVPVRTNSTNVPRTSVSTMRWGFGTRTLEGTVAKTVSMATIASRARVPGL